MEITIKQNDNTLLLYDRLVAIKTTIDKYSEDKFYLGFSGGKDSTVVHHLLDLAIPSNRIPRVFSNTGIEFNYIVDFVKELKKSDDRFKIIQPNKNIKKTLEEVGYPFKSKDHSTKLNNYQKGHRSHFVERYLKGSEYNGQKSK